MQLFVKMSIALLVVMLFVAATGCTIHRHYSCSNSTHKEQLLRNCIDDMMTNVSVIPVNHGLDKKSLSPWTYVPDKNFNRHPQTILNAECDPKGCPNQNASAQPIYFQIKVLMREKCSGENFFKFRVEPYKMKVGCTCVSYF